jgi:hypothetical protein
MFHQNFRLFYILARQAKIDTFTQINTKGRQTMYRRMTENLGF